MSGDGRQRGVIRLGAGARSGSEVARTAEARRKAETPQAGGRFSAAGRRPVELTRSAPAARISGRGVMQVNLNWSAASEADLDLGCMVRTRDGSGTAIQPLGEAFGSLTAWPYVSLDQDDRSGASSDGETLRISLEHRKKFSKLLVYVYVYEGAVDFRRLGGVVTVSAPEGAWRIHLDDSPPGATSCAIALIAPGREGLDLRREGQWFTPHLYLGSQQQLDAAYGFDLAWGVGTKTPR
ncbi:tellurium resistance protein [Streptomyces sp. NPDC057718]|uniref:tellurium resistance protein n=1 Tax=Streptomyces sp. NPDC057718 TaxID=3346225 RepID=UPI0036934712